MNSQIKTYEIKALCTNCATTQYVRLAKGTAIGSVECPNCGCKALTAHTVFWV